MIKIVDSALSQDYLDLEVIVSDNCSTDGTWELCWRLYSDHPKVKLCRNASNVGPVLTGCVLPVQLLAICENIIQR